MSHENDAMEPKLVNKCVEKDIIKKYKEIGIFFLKFS